MFAVVRIFSSTASVYLLRYLPVSVNSHDASVAPTRPTSNSSLSESLRYELLGSDVALLEVTMSVLDSERTDISIAVEPLESAFQISVRSDDYLLTHTHRIVLNVRWKLWVRHNAIECAINLCRDVTSNLEMLYFSLKATWFHKLGELRSFGESTWPFLWVEMAVHRVTGCDIMNSLKSARRDLYLCGTQG